ncbi:MAG: helix-turn-helix domain-containing protein [Bifidobacteriaceae bacterium]|jgi:transcriptional regulator with XRE-family HTH domain|nr:helix-turn-helix domain-containing protein [Bifidobacteriaceae bacterium]
MTDGDRIWSDLRSARDLGRFLSHLRAERGWTQAGLAAHLGIPRRYLHELENGKEILAYGRLFQLTALLGARIRIEAPVDPTEEVDPWQV